MRRVVGVLRGGPSSEYEVSLKSGASVLQALNQEHFEPRDIFIDRGGAWHMHGVAVDPERALRGIDVAFNAMHGEFGEDGEAQRLLERLGVPYTGSDARTSALAFNKHKTKEAVAKFGVKAPRGILVNPPTQDISLEDKALHIFRTFPHPVIVKPVIGGSSVGTTIADSYHKLEWALETALKVAPKALVEEYIKGREATVGVIDHFRNEKTYALMPVEIIPPPDKLFFDYEAKYGGRSTERVPGNFTDSEKRQLMDIAKKVHEGLNLSHYSRSDFILSRRGIYFLEVNTLPGLTNESLLPKALNAVGAKLSDFLHHIIDLAHKGKAR